LDVTLLAVEAAERRKKLQAYCILPARAFGQIKTTDYHVNQQATMLGYLKRSMGNR
jgi:hypothetical protein